MVVTLAPNALHEKGREKKEKEKNAAAERNRREQGKDEGLCEKDVLVLDIIVEPSTMKPCEAMVVES